MKSRRYSIRHCGLVFIFFLAVGLCGISSNAHAGGVNFSIGLGVPFPAYVAPPVVAYSAPVVVEEASPALVYAPPAVVERPPNVYYYGPPHRWYPSYDWRARGCYRNAHHHWEDDDD